MRLEYTDTQRLFRQEVRDWLAAHAPREPLASFDTELGFEQHRQWERTLHAGRWSSVTWPEEFGGRGCDLIEWLIFEEEYWAAGAPSRVNQTAPSSEPTQSTSGFMGDSLRAVALPCLVRVISGEMMRKSSPCLTERKT